MPAAKPPLDPPKNPRQSAKKKPPSATNVLPTAVQSVTDGYGFKIDITVGDLTHSGLRILRRRFSEDDDEYWSTIADFSDPQHVHPANNVVSFVDHIVKNGENFNYMVVTYNSKGESASSVYPSGAYPGTFPAATSHIDTEAPTIQYATDNMANDIQVVWQSPTTGTPSEIDVWRWTGSSWILVRQLGANATTWTDVGIPSGQGYYYCVGAYYTSENSSHYSTDTWGQAA